MERPLLFSRLLQFTIVLSFLLPFFFVGCEGGFGKTGESAATTDSMAVDTTLIVPADTIENKANTLLTEDSLSLIEDSIASSKEDSARINDDDEFKPDVPAALTVAKKHPWLESFLYSDTKDPNLTGKNFTGVGLLINVGGYFPLISIGFSFLFIISCLLSKFIDKEAVRTQLINNLIAVIFLSTYVPDLVSDTKALWGYWVCMILIFLTMLVDVRRLRLNNIKKLY